LALMKRVGDVALLASPRADGHGGPRPCLLFKRLPGDAGAWWVCPISSDLERAVIPFDEVLMPADEDFPQSGLLTPSVVRVGHVAIAREEDLIGSIGHIAKNRLLRIQLRVIDWLAGDA
jgi:mRNA interferase MazF